MDRALLCALAEHRTERQGWSLRPLDGPPEADALVILDFDDSETQARVLGEVRSDGFGGPVVIVGGYAIARSAIDEPAPRPVRLGVLLARIDSHRGPPEDVIMLGPYRFTSGERVLRDAGGERVIRLTELEQDFLLYLSAAEGALVSRDQLLADVWGYGEGVDSHTVETHVWRLRQKIETYDPATRFLVTEPGGYRLLVGGPQEE